ncbi:LuxR C-terminal-related transcriptional regulator [Spirillospora sp. CA-294931]|uniref:LuxR C-terminal-related transcriptional regulator n=1 Tax=Spirillospora sp. CA-294931 TaxID=3240042 RepID=UPI003D919F5F
MTEPLLERDDAHALIAEETEQARTGRGRLLLFRGATGTGRTAVLEAAAAHAADRGLRVLRVRCSPAETAAPFAAVRHLLASGSKDLPPVPDGDERERGEWFRDVVCRSVNSPMLLAVDDVQSADGASQRWFAEAARRADRLPILLVATERSQYDVDPKPAGLTRALAPDLVRTHTLAPLSARASAALVRDARPDATDAWTADVVRAGARNPLLLRALLEDLEGCGTPAVPDSCAALYPGAYPAAVSWWLENAGPATSGVARTLAALERAWIDGAESPMPDVLAAAAQADPSRTAGWLTAMTGLGLLRNTRGVFRFAHPLLRDAVLADWPVERARAAHRAAAETLRSRGDRTDVVAGQLLHTGVVGESWVPRVLRDAATGATVAARTGDAVGFLRRALLEPLPKDLRQRMLTELGSLEYASSGQTGGITRLAEALHLAVDPHEQVNTAMALGTALSARGEPRTAQEVLRIVADRLADRPETARTAWAAYVHLSGRDRAAWREASRWLDDAVERTPELVGPSGRALLVRFAAIAGTCSAREATARMRALLAEPADPPAEPFLLATAATIALWADDLDEAERLVERGLLGRRPALLHPMDQVLQDVHVGIMAARGAYGRLPAARGDGAHGPSHADVQALIALVETCREEEARDFADGFDLSGVPDSPELNGFLYARGELRSARGEVTGALHDFLECGRRQSAYGVQAPFVAPWRTAAAECHLLLGDHEPAVGLAEEELRLARVWGTPRVEGRALRVLGRAIGGRHGQDLAAEAVAVLRDSPATGELVEALLSHGRLLIAAGERARGRDLLQEAAKRAEALGAIRTLTEAERALHEAGSRRPVVARVGSEALTDSERRIAQLAVEGRTNREIAQLLQLAVRTVETHLTHAYRKLGIRQRRELREVLEPETTSGP